MEEGAATFNEVSAPQTEAAIEETDLTSSQNDLACGGGSPAAEKADSRFKFQPEFFIPAATEVENVSCTSPTPSGDLDQEQPFSAQESSAGLDSSLPEMVESRSPVFVAERTCDESAISTSPVPPMAANDATNSCEEETFETGDQGEKLVGPSDAVSSVFESAISDLAATSPIPSENVDQEQPFSAHESNMEAESSAQEVVGESTPGLVAEPVGEESTVSKSPVPQMEAQNKQPLCPDQQGPFEDHPSDETAASSAETSMEIGIEEKQGQETEYPVYHSPVPEKPASPEPVKELEPEFTQGLVYKPI